ncbi:MAG: ATP-binding protein [Actinophytocola sp.]|uniref:ATP-binding protein n=1 Tax=Actinophytocola sp. TaxID=1872138 RepID=UPI003D6BC5AD
MGHVVPESGQQDATRWRLNSWSLRTKVAVVLVVPAVVALALGGLRLQLQLDDANGLSTVRDQFAVLGEAVTLADLAAKEMVAAVPPNPAELPIQEEAVDRQVAVVRNAADFAQLPADVSRKLGDALSDLAAAREQAAENETDPVTEAFAYRAVIGELGELVPRVVSITRAEDLDDLASTVLSMLQLRASLASEEALIASGNGAAVSNDVAASIQHAAAEEAVLGQQLALDLPAAELPEFVAATSTWSERRDEIQEAVAKNRTADLQLLLPELQAEQTELRRLIDDKFTELVDTVSTRTNVARSDALRDAAIVLGALLAALAIALTVARTLLVPVRRLRAAALSVAHDKLPKTVERVRSGEHVDWRAVEPVAVRTDEEIGQLARAFDDMHQQAVRLAGEQAELRHQVSEMFMTLSRRSQSLVELQLGVIEGLEADEHDPRRLEGLFRLDHLATRLRRNGENLQVLAGGAPPKRGNRPVDVVELLRAATSEVKDYRRVSLGHAPNALVRVTAATDVVHILAELLENATRFSPPDRKVVLTADRGTDGGLLFEVIDTGLGMAAEDLEEANRRLAAADAIGPETTRRMGLFVVSLLAARHGLTVRLRPTYERAKQAGLTASVHVPGTLVLSAGAPETIAPAAAEPTAAPVSTAPPTAPLPAVPASDEPADVEESPVPVFAGGPPTVPPVPALPLIPFSNGNQLDWFTPQVPVEDVPRNGNATEKSTRGWLTPATPPTPAPREPAEDESTPASTKSTKAAKPDADGTSNDDSPTIRVTAAGLPVRTPGGGSRAKKSKPASGSTSGPTRKPSAAFRDPDTIRSNLSRHYSGMQAARRAREESDSESAPEAKS